MVANVQHERAVPPVDNEVNVYPTTLLPINARRISWGAILAGVVIALVTSFALQMLGLSLGAATVNPMAEVDPIEPALGTGAVLWYGASSLIALFLGGLVAGHMAGAADDTDGLLHGLVTWAVAAIITFFMITTSLGSVLGGITNAASQALSAAGQAAADVSPAVADALGVQDNALASIENEVSALLQEASEPAVTPEEGAEAATAQQTAATDGPMTLDEFLLSRSVRDFLNLETVNDGDRDELIALLAERTELTQEEARATVNRWEQTFTEVRNQAEETARQVAQATADAITALAGAIFLSMVLGAFAAGAGGMVGTPEPEDTVPEAA